jgi:hypothetical protein
VPWFTVSLTLMYPVGKPTRPSSETSQRGAGAEADCCRIVGAWAALGAGKHVVSTRASIVPIIRRIADLLHAKPDASGASAAVGAHA